MAYYVGLESHILRSRMECQRFNRNVSIGDPKYLLTLTDNKKRYVFVYFFKSREEVFGKFKKFRKMFEKQCERKIKTLRSENGKEFVNAAFGDCCKSRRTYMGGIERLLELKITSQHIKCFIALNLLLATIRFLVPLQLFR